MSFITNLWDKVVDKIGALASFIPAIASSLKVAIKEDDVNKVGIHLHELDEFADALKALVVQGQLAIEDGTLTLAEGSELVLAIENAIMEADDIVTGKDAADPVV